MNGVGVATGYGTVVDESSRALVIGAAEFLAAWRALRLGDTPVDLELEVCWLPGDSAVERRALLDQAHQRLQAQGRIDDRSSLAAALRVLADPAWTADLRIVDPDESWVALAASDGDRALVAVHRRGRVSLLATRPARIAPTLVELVGPLTPGRAHPVNIPADLLDQARRDSAGQGVWALADRLVALGLPRRDADSLARMCDGITAAGRLGVTGYRDGVERRGPGTVAFQRTRHGDFAHRHRDRTLTAGPVTADRLLAQLRDLIDATAPAGRRT